LQNGEDNRQLLKPPVGNKIYTSIQGDYIIDWRVLMLAKIIITMKLRLFYQLEGSIKVIKEDRYPQRDGAQQGDMYLHWSHSLFV
jgi:hypothetical protein